MQKTAADPPSKKQKQTKRERKQEEEKEKTMPSMEVEGK